MWASNLLFGISTEEFSYVNLHSDELEMCLMRPLKFIARYKRGTLKLAGTLATGFFGFLTKWSRKLRSEDQLHLPLKQTQSSSTTLREESQNPRIRIQIGIYSLLLDLSYLKPPPFPLWWSQRALLDTVSSIGNMVVVARSFSQWNTRDLALGKCLGMTLGTGVCITNICITCWFCPFDLTRHRHDEILEDLRLKNVLKRNV